MSEGKEKKDWLLNWGGTFSRGRDIIHSAKQISRMRDARKSKFVF